MALNNVLQPAEGLRLDNPVLFRKLSERLNEILSTLSGQWTELLKAMQSLESAMRTGSSALDAALPEMPARCAPFVRMLLEAAAGSEPQSVDQLQKIRDLTIELVDMIAGELTDTFWEPHKRPAQDALGARIFAALRAARLVPSANVSALKDRLLELTRANQANLTQL